MADHLAVLNMPREALKRSHTVTSFEPFTLLSALAASTERIGLVATASTTLYAPFHVARRFASLDHLSGGRAGWNIVTTANPSAALNFGLEEHMEHDERYRRAREFYDVVTGLWDSYGYAGLAFVGTPRTIADQMEAWLEGRGCDSFNVMFPYLPGGLEDFTRQVVPELQRRGLFRREYEGLTLRENLGLLRPENRFFV